MHSETIPTPHTALPAQLAISPGLSDSRRCFQSLAPSAPRLGAIERRKSAASSSSSSSSLAILCGGVKALGHDTPENSSDSSVFACVKLLLFPGDVTWLPWDPVVNQFWVKNVLFLLNFSTLLQMFSGRISSSCHWHSPLKADDSHNQ